MNHHSRNLCVFAEGEVDRSPTGSGVSARLAVLHARKMVAVGQVIKTNVLLYRCVFPLVNQYVYTMSFPSTISLQEVAIESILGRHSFFFGTVLRTERWAELDAIIPEVRIGDIVRSVASVGVMHYTLEIRPSSHVPSPPIFTHGGGRCAGMRS